MNKDTIIETLVFLLAEAEYSLRDEDVLALQTTIDILKSHSETEVQERIKDAQSVTQPSMKKATNL